MRAKNLLFIFVLTSLLVFAGCGSSEPPKNSTNKNVSKEPAKSKSNANSKADNPLETKTPAPRKEVNTAETLKPVVSAYCNAINKADDSALKTIFSKASWKALSRNAASDGKKSVAKYIGESEPIGKECKVINERIAGKVAEAVVITQTYPKGVPLKFVKESGSWKMTNQSSDFDMVRKNSKK